MKKTIIKILTITAGVIAALAAVAGVIYLIQKKTACKGAKKYVSCPQDEEADVIDEVDEVADIDGFVEDAE